MKRNKALGSVSNLYFFPLYFHSVLLLIDLTEITFSFFFFFLFPFQVLQAWNKKARRTMADLYNLLKDAERRGFVQAGTLKEIATGDRQSMEKSKYSFHSPLFTGNVPLGRCGEHGLPDYLTSVPFVVMSAGFLI